MRHRILLTTAVAVLLIGAGLVAVRLLGGPGSTLGEAVAMAPADAQRYTFTDWAAVRAEVERLQKRRDGITAQLSSLADIVSGFGSDEPEAAADAAQNDES